MKTFYSILAISSLALFACSCDSNQSGFSTDESGLQYKIVESTNPGGIQPKVNDIIEIIYSFETQDGKILFNSQSDNRKYLKRVATPAHEGGSIENGFMMMHEGDSAIFKIPAESFLMLSEKFGKLPLGVSAMDPIFIHVRLVNILDRDELENFVAKSYHNSEQTEIDILERYLQNSNFDGEEMPSGLYFKKMTDGNGRKPQNGNIVAVNYTVSFVDGKLLETTLDKQPFSFKIGDNQNIAGFEEGIMNMDEGSSAILIIPSKLAYGAEGNAKVLPYSTLIFEVELLKIN